MFRAYEIKYDTSYCLGIAIVLNDSLFEGIVCRNTDTIKDLKEKYIYICGHIIPRKSIVLLELNNNGNLINYDINSRPRKYNLVYDKQNDCYTGPCFDRGVISFERTPEYNEEITLRLIDVDELNPNYIFIYNIILNINKWLSETSYENKALRLKYYIRGTDINLDEILKKEVSKTDITNMDSLVRLSNKYDYSYSESHNQLFNSVFHKNILDIVSRNIQNENKSYCLLEEEEFPF